MVRGQNVSIEDLVRKAREELQSAEAITKYVTLGGEMVGVRFRPISGPEWRELKAQFLPRPGSFLDQNLGFNTDAVARAYPNICIVRGDDVDDLRRPDGEGGTRYIWPDVFDALEDPAIEIIVQALWEAHQYVPQMRMVEAGKALRTATQQKTQPSHSNSASPSANSTGTRPSRSRSTRKGKSSR